MKIKLLKNRNLKNYLRYCIALVVVLTCTMTACKKYEPQSTHPTSAVTPTITDFNPKVGYFGKPLTVTITGTNFSSDITGNTVYIGKGAQGKIIHASPTSLTVEAIWDKESSLFTSTNKYPQFSGPIIVETLAGYPFYRLKSASASDFKIVQNDGNPDITGFRNQYFEQGAGGYPRN